MENLIRQFFLFQVELNLLMLNLAEKYGAEIHFNSKCVDVDFNNTKATFLQVDQKKHMKLILLLVQMVLFQM